MIRLRSLFLFFFDHLVSTDAELFDHVLVLAYNVEDSQLSCKDT